MSTESEKMKGSAKEAAGDLTGKDDLKQEGEQQQKKARKSEEAAEKQREADEKAQEAAGHAGAEKRAD